MNNLDDIAAMMQLDKSNVYGSVVALPKQCAHAWEDLKDFTLPDDYKHIDNIIMTGMGGSGLGARIIESVYGLGLRCPLIHIHDYDLPQWADEKTLVICSAFSGETEEPVETARQAQVKGCKWMSIGTGGTIIELAKKYNRPYYQINPVHNPSRQPRMANGYSVIGQLVMLSKTGLISIRQTEIATICKVMDSVIRESKIDVPISSNPAKKLATALHSRIFVLVGARHMMGASHLVKNQANENAKTFAVNFDIPELNHHLMEGLAHPKVNSSVLHFLFIQSRLYPERIQKRFTITEEIVNKYGIPYTVWQTQSNDALSQAFELVQFGAFVNHYLAMFNNLDPAPIPWVDYFKKQLGQPLGQWK